MDGISERWSDVAGHRVLCRIPGALSPSPRRVSARLGFRQSTNPNVDSRSTTMEELPIEELRHWAKVRKCRDQAIRYLKLARMTADPDTQNQLIKIAQRYRALADAEECGADAERRSTGL
jgi:hypothetical protein